MKMSGKKNGSARGFTLVELMVALMIFALLATATMSMMMASANTQRYVMNNTEAVSEAELGFRRIVENLRSASQASCPSATEIDLVTQPDTSKSGNPVYNVKYQLVFGQLVETDDRYGMNVLASNVTTFSATTVQNNKPTMFQIMLTISPSNSAPVTRSAYITSRNF